MLPTQLHARAAFVLGLYVFVGGLVSLSGWIFDQPRLTDWFGNGISTQPNTALAALAAGSAVFLLAWDFRWAAAALGGLIVLIGSTVIFQYLTGLDLGVDSLLMFDRSWGRVGVIEPGRMGPPGAASWTIIGAALLLAPHARSASARRLVLMLALLPATIAALSLIGYFYGASALYTIPTMTAIALQTATFIFATSIGLIASVPEHGPMRLFSQQTPAGLLTRRLLPFLVLIPILFGLARLAGERAQLYDAAFGSALRSIIEIGLFLLLLWRTGLAIDRQTQQRKQAEAERERLLVAERAARADAEQQATLKDEFLATLSHELRTPLNAVLGWSQVLRKDLGDVDKARHALDIIERNGRLQAQLIADLLDMSRIVSGKMRLDVQRLDLPAVIDAAIESIRPAADAKSVTIEQVIEPLAEVAHGDPARLQQVVWNLLSNAVKFTPRGGRILVSLASVSSRVQIRISDTGEGIAAEFLPTIFDRFRQADATAARAHGGLGLGLALVKQLVELHGGEVTAASDGIGKGSTFILHLPFAILQPRNDARPARVHAVEQDNAANRPSDLRGVSVLIVDDEPDSLELTRRMLEDCEATVAGARGTDEALSLLEQRRFDVIVSDIGMPHRDGYELMRECRARGVASPAIALTAFARAQDGINALSSGYQRHVAKPVAAAELLAAVAGLAGAERQAVGGVAVESGSGTSASAAAPRRSA